MDRIVDIATDGRHLSLHRGFLLVSEDRTEVGRIALDDVHAVIVHAHGTTWSANLAAALAERGAPLVFCAANHSPVAMTLPVAGHHAQNARMRAQWDAPRPLAKPAWRRPVSAKITMQGALLAARGVDGAGAFDLLARRVKSGDPDNVEAQAARRYWPLLMGRDFRRDRDSPGANALLNYGYAVMRATVARAVVAARAAPHHRREPRQPRQRAGARGRSGGAVPPARRRAGRRDGRRRRFTALDPAVKRRLTRLIALDLRIGGDASPVSLAAVRLAQSLARSFETGRVALALFDPPTPTEWGALARLDELETATA